MDRTDALSKNLFQGNINAMTHDMPFFPSRKHISTILGLSLTEELLC